MFKEDGILHFQRPTGASSLVSLASLSLSLGAHPPFPARLSSPASSHQQLTLARSTLPQSTARPATTRTPCTATASTRT